MAISYIKGDATSPDDYGGVTVIAHVCNDAGKWGDELSGSISRKWKDPKEYYKAQYRFAKKSFKLGKIQWVFVESEFAVVNMIAQEGERSLLNTQPIRYDALESCLNLLAKGCLAIRDESRRKVTVHMPKIGCGIGGGEWSTVGAMIEDALWDIDVYVYEP